MTTLVTKTRMEPVIYSRTLKSRKPSSMSKNSRKLLSSLEKEEHDMKGSDRKEKLFNANLWPSGDRHKKKHARKN